MNIYVWVKIHGYDVAVNSENHTVHHAVSKDGQRTLYPYESCKDGGLDNCSGCYTADQFRRKMKNGTACFE